MLIEEIPHAIYVQVDRLGSLINEAMSSSTRKMVNSSASEIVG
jgi:hypothetical protein